MCMCVCGCVCACLWGGQRGSIQIYIRPNITLKRVIDFVNDLQTEKGCVCACLWGGQRGFIQIYIRLNITLKRVIDFVNDLQTEKLLKKWIPSNISEHITKMVLQRDLVLTGDLIVSIVDGGHINLVHTGR